MADKPATPAKPAEAAKPAAKPAEAAKPTNPAKPATSAKPAPLEGLPTPPAWWKTLRADPPPSARFVLGVGMIVVIAIAWWLVTRGDPPIVSPVKLPPPGPSFQQFEVPDLLESIIDTLERVFLGVGLAAIVGVTLGFVSGASRAAAAVLSPLVIFLRSIPMGALLPLMLILFGLGEEQGVMFLFFALVAFVFSDTMKAVALVPERYVETALTLGGSRMQIIRKVLIPLALPDIITSLRFQVGLALGYIMLAEDIGVDHGLGHAINMAQRLGKAGNVYVMLFIIAGIAFALDLILRTIQRGLFGWRQDL